MEDIIRIKQMLEQDRPENWDTLPDIELYMDQVVSYLPRQSVGGKVPSMTSAMINNYVKDGLLPRACGKRYHKEHLIYLTAIGLLKNVLTVKDMKLLLDGEIREGQERDFYEKFMQGIDEAFLPVEERLPEELPQEDLRSMAMRLALTSCAAKTACEHLLAVIRAEETPEGQKAKKDKEKDAAKKAKPEKAKEE